MKYLLCTIIVGLLFITSCDKKNKPIRYRYPEDIEDYDATPTERIANRWWILDSVSLNGMDYTDTVYNKVGEYKLYLSTTEDESNGQTVKLGSLFTSIPILVSNDPFTYITWAISANLHLNFNTGPFKQDINTFTPLLCLPLVENYSKWQIMYLKSSGFKLLLSKTDTTIINYFKLQ